VVICAVIKMMLVGLLRSALAALNLRICSDNYSRVWSHRLALGSLATVTFAVLVKSGDRFSKNAVIASFGIRRAQTCGKLLVFGFRGFDELFAPGILHEPFASL